MMYGLVFGEQTPPITSSPNRADIALFVGFVRRRVTPLPASLERWLHEYGWTDPNYARLPLADLLDLPVPVENWDTFDYLFEWEQRPLAGETATTYLGAAVRSFFAQGGRKCYVVRVGDPWAYDSPRADRLAQVSKLIPGYPLELATNPVDRTTWRGVGHLFGLPDVSFLCLPDLPDAVSIEREVIPPKAYPSVVPEQFVECSDNEPDAIDDDPAQFIRAPHCDENAYVDWARAINRVAGLLIRRQREVQLIAALPLPAGEPARNLLRYLTADVRAPLSAAPDYEDVGIASAFVQLTYPWLRTRGSDNLPEGLESPDAVLAGMLARGALTRGAFRSAANVRVADVFSTHPALGREAMLTKIPDNPVSGISHSLIERVSLFGQSPAGLVLLSDNTTSLNESYRPAGVNRLVSIIVRAARRVGEDSLFEVSSQAVWASLKERLDTLLFGLLQAGALRGRNAAEAFEVRCDRTTMSQNDIDAGRLIAEIRFNAALPIETITVTLAMNAGGQVSLEASHA